MLYDNVSLKSILHTELHEESIKTHGNPWNRQNRCDWRKISKIAYDIDCDNAFNTFITVVFLTEEEFEKLVE